MDISHEIDHLGCCVAVAEELNIRHTATRLHLSGQKHLYPFAVLLRELPAERRWNLLQRPALACPLD